MIRRDLKTDGGDAEWLLFSQVEHARLSGEIARHWTADDLSPRACDGVDIPQQTTAEILAAISHHDEGWIAWEAAPKIDPAHDRPYSFLSEMPLEGSLAIWDGSIASARANGPLAGWMVAGHFYELLTGSGDVVKERAAAAWLKSTDRKRQEWLETWLAAAPGNSPRMADRALWLLQLADQLSLWLCCICPVAPEEDPGNIEPFVLDWQENGVGMYRFQAQRRRSESPSYAGRFAHSNWIVVGAPWPFAEAELCLTADAWLAPVRRYSSSAELVNVRQPVKLGWQLTSGP